MSDARRPLFLLTLAEIERHLHEGGGWCDLGKAHGLASLVWALRPDLVVEIGVWQGGSLIPLLIAMRDVGHGRAIAIDPWKVSASIQDEAAENIEWWGTQVGQPGHDAALACFRARLVKHEVDALCDVWRARSDDVDPPPAIDILHLDGNHTDQAVRDVARFAPRIRVGGALVLDDLEWAGGGVGRARELAIGLGFAELYRLGTGCVMQRTNHQVMP